MRSTSDERAWERDGTRGARRAHKALADSVGLTVLSVGAGVGRS